MLDSDPFPVFSATLRDILRGLVSPDATGFLDMVAEDVVMEFPYAPAGGTPAVSGRSALAAYLAEIAGSVTIDSMSIEAVHRTATGGVVVAEFSAAGRGKRRGTPYQQRYISVIQVEGGQIRRYRDYWNPLAFLETLKGETA